MVFRKINWRGGISVNGERLNHLRLAYDMAFIANNEREINETLQGLNA